MRRYGTSPSPSCVGIDNTSFYRDNTVVLFGYAKKITQEM